MQEITPIIVVGMNRTGTKWVSNILCNHQDVIGAQTDRSRGILESNMFGVMQDKFDLSSPDEYVGLLELWSVTEIFKCANGNKEAFYNLNPRPRNAIEMFRILLQEYARSNDKAFWLQKVRALRALEVLESFKDARIVVTRRRLLDTMKSTWAMHLRYRQRRPIRSTYMYVRQEKILNRICKKYNAAEVQYENLKADPEREISQLCKQLRLDPAKITSEYSYKKNSSFANEHERVKIMSSSERILVVAVALFSRCVPLILMTLMANAMERIAGRSPRHLTSGTFGSLVDRLADRTKDAR